MPEIQLSSGTIEYGDTDPAHRDPADPARRPTIVFLHGVVMNSSVWDGVVERLRGRFRCITPTMPLGGHRIPMDEDADLSFGGQVRLIEELLEALDLDDVTLVFNDWSGANLLIAEGRTARVGRLVLTSTEAFDNYPPGLPGKVIRLAAKPPGGLYLALQSLRIKSGRRAPWTFGWMAKKPIPHDVFDGWIRPATTDRAIRRDIGKYVRCVPPRSDLLRWADLQREFRKPVLIAWSKEDKVMPPEHGRRLAELFPNATLVEIDDAYVLSPLDQPQRLADEIGSFADAPRTMREKPLNARPAAS